MKKVPLPTSGSKLTRFIGRALGLVSSVVAGKAAREQALREAKDKLERMQAPPDDWAPFLRQQTRMNLWFKATVKAHLKAIGGTKAYRQHLRARFLQGHWDRPQLTPDDAIPAGGAAARKRRQHNRRIAFAGPAVGETATHPGLVA